MRAPGFGDLPVYLYQVFRTSTSNGEVNFVAGSLVARVLLCAADLSLYEGWKPTLNELLGLRVPISDDQIWPSVLTDNEPYFL